MDWNLNSSKQQKIADRVLDLLEENIEGRPVTRSLAKSHAVNLQEGMQVRNCTNGNTPEPKRSRIAPAYKPANNARNKWFDAK